MRRYSADDRELWNEFARASKNGTFLFQREYMEYHADRFQDSSLLVTRGEAVVALVPASRHGDEVKSHGGLTYGGMISNTRMSASLMLDAFEVVAHYLRREGARTLLYKPVPHIYHQMPAEEDLYALFRAGARLVRRDLSSSVEQAARGPLTKGRKWSLNRARRGGLEVRESDDIERFMTLESDLLEEKYGTAPTHTAAELQLLMRQFPQNIRLFCAYRDTRMLAGVVVYESARVAHAQYIAASEEGKGAGALDAVIDSLLAGRYSDKQFFDFGISTEDEGRRLNPGLVANKESYGARTTVYDQYVLDL